MFYLWFLDYNTHAIQILKFPKDIQILISSTRKNMNNNTIFELNLLKRVLINITSDL